MKKNEEIVYNILKKYIVIIVLVPFLVTGLFVAYQRIVANTLYSASSTMILNNNQDDMSNTVEENYAMTNAIVELAQSYEVLGRASERINQQISTDELKNLLLVETKSDSLTIVVKITKNDDKLLFESVKAITESTKEISEEIYYEDVIEIVDTPDVINTSKQITIGKTKIFGIFGISFIVTLFSVLSLKWNSVKNSNTDLEDTNEKEKR